MQYAFNPNTVPADPAEDSLIPEGQYHVVIAKDPSPEIRTTKAGTGEYLAVSFTIVGPKLRGRRIFEKYTVRNPNPMAVEIGQRELARLCRAVGLLDGFQDTEELEGRSLHMVVSQRKRRDNGEAENYIKSYIKSDVPAPVKAPEAPKAVHVSSNDLPF